MPLYTVSYDLNDPGQNYAAVHETLKAIGATRILYSQWGVRWSGTARELFDAIFPAFDTNDRILVQEVTANSWQYNLVADLRTL